MILYLSRRSEHSSSNLPLVSVVSICLGPSAVAVMKGKLKKPITGLETEIQKAQCLTPKWEAEPTNLIFVWVNDDNSILALSAASVRRWRACLSFSRSIPSSFLKLPASQSTILWQQNYLSEHINHAEP